MTYEGTDHEYTLCPTIRLNKEEKPRLRKPWRKTLFVKLFDKRVGFMQSWKGLKAKWAPKGDFNLIDIGFDYLIFKFACDDDYDYVMTRGRWLIGDSY